MNHFLKYSFSFFCLLACSACNDDGIDILDIEIPEGYALSAGTSTIFLNSSVAYDTPADWITGAYDVRFTRGDRLYDDVRTSNNGHGGGLGPVYAGYSCGSCHRNAGRTKPSLWTEGGSGSYGFSSMLVYISRKTELSFKIMDVCFMTRQSMECNRKANCLWNTLTRHFLSLMEKPTHFANPIILYLNGMPKKSNRKICFVPYVFHYAM